MSKSIQERLKRLEYLYKCVCNSSGGGGGGVGTVTSIATTEPITGGTITTSGTIGINQVTTSTDGYLSSTDWNIFNSEVFIVKPEENQIIIFPGHLEHASDTTTDTSVRYCIGVNYFIDDSLGSNEHKDTITLRC